MVGACSTRAPLQIRCVQEHPLVERGKPLRVGATPEPRGVSTRQAEENGDAGGTHPYRTWDGRGVFHPRPTSNPLRARTPLGGTWEAPARWAFPRSPSCLHGQGGGIWGRGWNASLPNQVGRGAFHPRPTSNPLRARTPFGGTREAPARGGYPRSPSCLHAPGGGIWGRGWNASLPNQVGRGVFHPRPTSNPLRARTPFGGTREASARWAFPRSPACLHAPGGGLWGRGWNASLPSMFDRKTSP